MDYVPWEKSSLASLSAERKAQWAKKEAGHSRQELAKREFKFQLSPRDYSRIGGLKGHPSPSSGSPGRKGLNHETRGTQGHKQVWFSFSSSCPLNIHSHPWDICLFLSLKVILIYPFLGNGCYLMDATFALIIIPKILLNIILRNMLSPINWTLQNWTIQLLHFGGNKISTIT